MKQLTKRQREKIQAAKDALRGRMRDFLLGALHGVGIEAGDNETDLLSLVSGGAEEWSGWMRACRAHLSIDEEYAKAYREAKWSDDKIRGSAFKLYCMPKFESFDVAVDHLYEHGFRA